jgi:nucleoid-associated protein YgaU
MVMTLDIQQPQPYDLVTETIQIAGMAAAFEGTMTVRLSDGHDEFATHIQVGATGLKQFQGSVTVPPETAFTLSRVFLTLADDTGNENGPKVTIPILYGPLILPGYSGWQPYTVQPGDTLIGVAQRMYGTPDYGPIFAANQDILDNANEIYSGQVLRIPRNDI